MDTFEFFKKVWPDSGHYFIDTPYPNGGGFKHHHCDSIGEAVARAKQMSSQGVTVYFACASFREEFIEVPDKKNPGQTKQVFRVQDNVKLVKSFWLDLDVDPVESSNKYIDQRSAILALAAFLKETGLPRPMVVSSGYGVHLYWPLTETLLPTQWKNIAEKLKALCIGLNFKTDLSRTSDQASVLRPIGTINYKVKNGLPAAKPVELISDAELVDLADFEKRINLAFKTHGLNAPVARGKPTSVNDPGLTVPTDYPDSWPEVIADKCNQVKLMRDKGGDIEEPHWYGAIQILHFAKGGDEAIHKWSSPYAGYSASETDSKIEQIASMGPTSCSTMEQRNAKGCEGCPFRGKVVSPIQLGIKVEDKAIEKIVQPSELGDLTIEIPPPPAPFRRTTHGLFLEADGVPLRFYRYDLFPIALVWDDADDYMTVSVRHELPKEGWQDFDFPAGTLSSQKEFDTLLVGKGVLPDNPKNMRIYMTNYLQNLQNSIKMQRLYDTLGWKDGTNFVLGKRIFTPEGINHAGLSRVVPETLVNGISKKGDLAVWSAAISKYTRPGLEAHLFSVCVGFGAPLLEITGFNGCMLSMLGESNAGKSLAARAALSIYGRYEDLQSGKNDTMNARMERLNALANLPVYFDELTNIDPKELSNLVYMLSQGRGREKLRSDSSTRAAAKWSTIAMGSTNQSMYNLLAHGKDNAEAEMMRVLEITIPKISWFEEDMHGIFDVLRANYGVAGEHYIKFIVEQRATIDKQIRGLVEMLNKATGFEGKERFWSSLCACVLYGYIAACRIGLIHPTDFKESFNRLFDWTRRTIVELRGEVTDNVVDEVAGVGHYINMYQSGTLVVYPVMLGDKEASAIRKRPTSSLVMRVEEDKGWLWIDRKHLRRYFGEKQMNYDKVKKQLMSLGILISIDERKMLGAGTEEFRSTQIPTWKINLRAASLEGVMKKVLLGEESPE